MTEEETAVPEDYKVIANKEDVEGMNKIFKNFNHDVSSKIEEIRDLMPELIIFKDDKQAITIQLASSKLNVTQLADLGAKAFQFVQQSREPKSTEGMGIG